MAVLKKGALTHFLQARYHQWLDKRIPPAKSISLNQRNVFIFPVFLALVYIGCVAILWIAATNYENNLAFAMCFLMLSLFVVCIIHTFNNLAGLILSGLDCEPVFAGELANCKILVASDNKREYNNISMCWDEALKTTLDLRSGERVKTVCKFPTRKRGYVSPGRLKIETVYPLGILRSWSYLDLDLKILVYPRPLKCDLPPVGVKNGEEGNLSAEVAGGDEFNSLKDYFVGAPLKHLAWKQFAKGRGLHVKDYSDFVDRQLVFDWDLLPSMGVEDKLSALCYWVLEAESSGDTYGVKIPDFEKAPDRGDLHQAEILRALALFGERS